MISKSYFSMSNFSRLRSKHFSWVRCSEFKAVSLIVSKSDSISHGGLRVFKCTYFEIVSDMRYSPKQDLFHVRKCTIFYVDIQTFMWRIKTSEILMTETDIQTLVAEKFVCVISATLTLQIVRLLCCSWNSRGKFSIRVLQMFSQCDRTESVLSQASYTREERKWFIFNKSWRNCERSRMKSALSSFLRGLNLASKCELSPSSQPQYPDDIPLNVILH